MAHEMHQDGISVPQPEGIFTVKIRWLQTLGGIWFPRKIAFVMQRIHGIQSTKVPRELEAHVRALFHAEKAKCYEKRFYHVDEEVMFSNSMYAPGEDKLYLLDCREWRRKR